MLVHRTGRAPLSGAVAVLLAVLAFPMSAGAAKSPKKPDLRTSGVRGATVAHGGGALPVTLKVATTGRTRQTSARRLLSKDNRRSADDLVLPGPAACARLAGAGS